MYKSFLILISIVMFTACSSDKTLEDIVDDIKTESPMRFNGNGVGEEEETITRGSTPLTTGFDVSCWKNFGDEVSLQTVMDLYEVQYTAGATYQWTYDEVPGQFLRYWDLSAYPYEFRAVTPHLPNANLSILPSCLSIGLTSPGLTHFKAQTFLEMSMSQPLTDSEPCLVAQVNRAASNNIGEYVDRDIIAQQTINTIGASNAVRPVHLPFHHLMSKVGFRLYIDDPIVPTYDIKLSDVSISIFNAQDKFLVESQTYTASNEPGLLNGTFSDVTLTTTPEQPLITKTGVYTSVNMANHLSHDQAFDFYCPEDMLQIPQSNLKIRVHFKMLHNGQEEYYDRLLAIDPDNLEGDYFEWKPNVHYIYYLHIKNLVEHPIIVCTAELVPWDIVHSSNVEIGL